MVRRRPQDERRRRRGLSLGVSLGLSAAALAVVLATTVLSLRPLAPSAPACDGGMNCAAHAAAALRDAAKAARSFDLLIVASPLARALERSDCAAAGEYARALPSVTLAEDAGPHGPLARARDTV